MGSSIVMMWHPCSSLILFTKAASVEDFPLPVGFGDEHQSRAHFRGFSKLWRQIQFPKNPARRLRLPA